MRKKLTIDDFKHDGTGFKYEIKAGDKVDLYLDFTTSALLRENEILKAQRDELLDALKGIVEIEEDDLCNGVPVGVHFSDRLSKAKKAIENCK